MNSWDASGAVWLAVIIAWLVAGCVAPLAPVPTTKPMFSTPLMTSGPTAGLATWPEPTLQQTPTPLAPTPKPQPTPSVLATASPATTSPPTSEPTPGAALFAWTRPIAIATTDAAFDAYQTAIATDERGRVHVVVGSRDGIIYLQHRDGEWRESLITAAQRGGYEGSPAIAVDEDGTVAIVFQKWARWECQMAGCAPNDSLGVALIQGDGDRWSEPEIIGAPSAREPDVLIYDGVVYMTYVDDEAIWFLVKTTAESIATAVAPTGDRPWLATWPYCPTAVLFTLHEEDVSRLVVALKEPDERFRRLDGPTFDSYTVPAAITLTGPFCFTVVAARNQLWGVRQTGWVELRTLFPSASGLTVGDIAVYYDSRLEIVSSAAHPSESMAGLWFAAAYDDEPFSLENITAEAIMCCNGGQGQALAVDSDSQPHLVWATGQDEVTIWYATGRRLAGNG